MDFKWSCNEISLEKNDRIVLFSDGIVDQFSYDNSKKYGYKRLEEMILSNSPLDPKNLERSIYTDLEFHQGGNIQTDDILLLAFDVE